jgi:hypothetical protein
MHENPDPQSDPVDGAVAALRDTFVPPGPSPMLSQRTLAAIRSRDRNGTARINMTRVAAAIALFLCAIALFVVLSHRNRNTVVQQSPPAAMPHPPSTPVVVRHDDYDHSATPSADDRIPTAMVASNVSVTGRVFYHGPSVARRPIDLSNCTQCIEVSHGPIYDDSLLVNAGGTLENVVVSISAGLPPDGTFEPPVEPVVLDQKGCMFRPHVVASMVGQGVVVKNSDPLLHSVHSMDADETPAFNFAQPTIGQRAVEPIRVVETFRVKCDLHPWMNAWVRVFNHPYFSVTQADGAFSIRNLPPGTYRIKAWHELLGVQEKKIEVSKGKPAMVEFEFGSTNVMQNAK